MSAEGTKSETPGHGPAPSQDHHDFVGVLRQTQANAEFLFRFAPVHEHDPSRGIPSESLRQAGLRLQESMMWATTGIYGKAKLPPPDRATLLAASSLSPAAAAAAAEIFAQHEHLRGQPLQPASLERTTPEHVSGGNRD